VVVGDSPFDMQAAKKLGIKTIGVRSGGFAEQVLLDAAPTSSTTTPRAASQLRRFASPPGLSRCG
jgi:phosphoglycolate phosphatase-like HAD superfamily hydrolase